VSDRDELLSLAVAASRLDVGTRTLLYWARHDDFPLFLVKGRPYVWWGAVLDWVQKVAETR
jgi:hypothetical protein